MKRTALGLGAIFWPLAVFAQETVPRMGWLVGKMVIVLVLLVGVMVLASRYLRNRIPGARSSELPIELLSARPLGPKRILQVIRVQGKTLLLGVTEHSIHTLAQWPSADAEDKPVDSSFQNRLADAMNSGENEDE